MSADTQESDREVMALVQASLGTVGLVSEIKEVPDCGPGLFCEAPLVGANRESLGIHCAICIYRDSQGMWQCMWILGHLQAGADEALGLLSMALRMNRNVVGLGLDPEGDVMLTMSWPNRDTGAKYSAFAALFAYWACVAAASSTHAMVFGLLETGRDAETAPARPLTGQVATDIQDILGRLQF